MTLKNVSLHDSEKPQSAFSLPCTQKMSVEIYSRFRAIQGYFHFHEVIELDNLVFDSLDTGDFSFLNSGEEVWK